MGLMTRYREQMQALLPQGFAWQRAKGAFLTQLLDALSLEFLRSDTRMINLINEADPRTTDELLKDWERVYGLPDPCVVAAGVQQNLSERRAALVSLITMQGGQSKAFFIALAKSMGYDITIKEWHPYTTESRTDEFVIEEEAYFVWQVNLSNAVDYHESTTLDHSETPTAWWRRFELLECRLNRFKPAHTYLIFSYNTGV